MKKIFFAAIMIIALGAIADAQAPAAKANTQKKEAAKPATSISTVTSTTKKSTNNTKPKGTTVPGQKVTAANIGKHKKTHHKAKKPAKKS